MLKQSTTGLIVCLVLFCAPLHAEPYAPESTEEVEAQYHLLKSLHERGDLADAAFARERERLRRLALERFDLDLEAQRLEQLSETQRLDWFSTALIIGGIILGLVVAIPLSILLAAHLRRALRALWRLARPLLKALWRPLSAVLRLVWPTLRHLLVWVGSALARLFKGLRRATLGLINWLRGLPPWIWEGVSYPAMIGGILFTEQRFLALGLALILAPLIIATSYIHGAGWHWRRRTLFVSLALTLAWGAAAIIHHDAVTGLLAVGAFCVFMGLGFYRLPEPEAGEDGYREEAAVAKTTLASLLILCAAWYVYYSKLPPADLALTQIAEPFRPGIIVLVGLVFYTGLFVLSGKWYGNRPYYSIANLLALAGGAGMVVLAFFYSMHTVFWLGSLFMLGWLMGKFYEFIYLRLEFVYSGAIVSAILGLGGYWIKTHLGEIVEFLAPVLP